MPVKSITCDRLIIIFSVCWTVPIFYDVMIFDTAPVQFGITDDLGPKVRLTGYIYPTVVCVRGTTSSVLREEHGAIYSRWRLHARNFH